MYVNVEKGKVMSISKSHCNMKFVYYVDGQSLTRVDCMIDLGVPLTHCMTPKNHILKNGIQGSVYVRFGQAYFRI